MFVGLRRVPRYGLGVLLGLMVWAIAGLIHTQPAAAAGYCGSGYNFVGQYPMRVLAQASPWAQAKYGAAGTVAGSLDIYWNPYAKKNCAIARATGKNYGQVMQRRVTIGISGRPYWDDEQGAFRYYAGPVYTVTQSPHECIYAWGQFMEPDGRIFADASISRAHCG